MEITNQYELPQVAPASTGVGGNQTVTTNPGSGSNQRYAPGEDTTNFAIRLSSVENYVNDIYANYARLGSSPSFADLNVSERLTANWGTIGGFSINSGVLSATNLILDSNNQRIVLGEQNGIIFSGIDKTIKSSNYQTGTSGFLISPDLVEAENLIARGTLRGATFAYDVVSAVGGQLMVTNADALAEDMTALDASTLETKGDTTFAVNDILLMRGVATTGIEEEWMRVTNITNAPIYTVTRDIKGDYAADSNPVWKAGTPVVKQGSSDGASTYSGGWLRLIGEGTNAPYYSVFARNGVAYNAYTEAVRMGNLNGIGSNVTDVFGFYAGDSTKYLQYDPTGGLVLVGSFSVNSNYTAASAITAGDIVEQGTVASEVQRQTINDTSLTNLYDISTLSIFDNAISPCSCQLDMNNLVVIYHTTTAANFGVTTLRLNSDTRFMKPGPVYTASITDARTPYYIYGMVRIASDKVLVCYDGNNAGTTRVFARVITVASDGQLTFSAATNVTTPGADGKLVRMADNKVAFATCRAGDFRLIAVVMTISGTTITLGTEVDIGSGVTFGDMVLYDTDKLLISHTSTVQPISVSGTTITAGTSASSGSDTRGRLAKISTTKVLYLYNNSTVPNITCRAAVVNLASNVATLATSYEVESTTFEANTAFPLCVNTKRGLALYKKESPADVNVYGKYLDIDSSDVITVGSIIIVDYQTSTPNNKYLQEVNFDYDSGFDFILYTNVKYLTSGFFRASKRALGVAPTSVAAAATLNLVNKGLITGLSGYTVGQQIRDKFNNSVIAVAKTTTSINVI